MVQEIHFYTNLSDPEQASDWDLETIHTDYVSTLNAIYGDKEEIVKTTQISFLAAAWDLIDNGARLFIHNGHETLEIKEHMDIFAMGVHKDIRRGHNMEKLFMGGALGDIK